MNPGRSGTAEKNEFAPTHRRLEQIAASHLNTQNWRVNADRE
jgi:hypothetical protein